MGCLTRRIIASVLIGSLVCDPSLAAAGTMSLSRLPRGLDSPGRLSAITHQAIVQPLITPRRVRPSLAPSRLLALSGLAAGVGGWKLWQVFADLATQTAPLGSTAFSVGKTLVHSIETVQRVQLQANGSPWKVAEHTIGDGRAYQTILDLNPGARWYKDDWVYAPAQFHVTDPGAIQMTLTEQAYRYPLFHDVYQLFQDPLTWLIASAVMTVMAGGIYWGIRRWKKDQKPSIAETLSMDQRLKKEERALAWQGLWEALRAFFQPRSLAAATAALFVLSFISQSFTVVARTLSWHSLGRDAIEQTARRQRLARQAAALHAKAQGHASPVTVGAQVVLEKPNLKFVGPTVNLTVPLKLMRNPMRAYEAAYAEREKEKARLADLQARREQIHALVEAGAHYSEKQIVVDRLEAFLAEETLSDIERLEAEAERAVAKAERDGKRAALERLAGLPPEALPEDASLEAMTLEDMQAALQDMLKESDEPSADAAIGTLDAQDAAKRVAARGSVRWHHYALRSRVGISVGVNAGLVDFPLGWLLGNGALAFPQYGPKNLEEQRQAFHASRQALADWERDTRAAYAQALADWRAAQASPEENDTSRLQAIRDEAARARDKLLATARMRFMGIDRPTLAALAFMTPEEQDRQIPLWLDPTLAAAQEALDEWDAALCVEESKIKTKAKSKKRTPSPAVAVSPLPFVGFTSHASRASNSALEFEAETGTAGMGVVVNWLRGSASVEELQSRLEEVAQEVAAMEKAGDRSPRLWALRLVQVTGETLTQTPITVSATYQQSPNVKYPWVSIGMKDVLWKPLGRGLKKIVRRRLPKKVRQSIEGAFDAYELALTRELWVLRQAALYGSEEDRERYADWETFLLEAAPRDEVEKDFQARLGRMWNEFRNVTARADFDVLLAQAAQRDAAAETVSPLEDWSWNPADPFWAFYRDTTNPDSPIGLPLYGFNTALSNNPQAKTDKKKQQAEKRRQAARALAEARQKAGLHRATWAPVVSVLKGQADWLRALAASPEYAVFAAELQSLAGARDRQAVDTALREGLDPAAIPAMDVTQRTGALTVPDRQRLVLALEETAAAPGTPHARAWIVDWVHHVPFTVNAFTQNLAREWGFPKNQVGLTVLFGPWDPMNLPGLNRARKKDARAAEEAAKAVQKENEQTLARALAYQIAGLLSQSEGYHAAAPRTWAALQSDLAAMRAQAFVARQPGAPAPNPIGFGNLLTKLDSGLSRHAGALALQASARAALAVLFGTLSREKLADLGIRTEGSQSLPALPEFVAPSQPKRMPSPFADLPEETTRVLEEESVEPPAQPTPTAVSAIDARPHRAARPAPPADSGARSTVGGAPGKWRAGREAEAGPLTIIPANPKARPDAKPETPKESSVEMTEKDKELARRERYMTLALLGGSLFFLLAGALLLRRLRRRLSGTVSLLIPMALTAGLAAGFGQERPKPPATAVPQVKVIGLDEASALRSLKAHLQALLNGYSAARDALLRGSLSGGAGVPGKPGHGADDLHRSKIHDVRQRFQPLAFEAMAGILSVDAEGLEGLDWPDLRWMARFKGWWIREAVAHAAADDFSAEAWINAMPLTDVRRELAKKLTQELRTLKKNRQKGRSGADAPTREERLRRALDLLRKPAAPRDRDDLPRGKTNQALSSAA